MSRHVHVRGIERDEGVGRHKGEVEAVELRGATKRQKPTLIKRRRVRPIQPWILQRDQTRTIEHRLRKLAPLKERPVEAHVEEGVQACVYVYASRVSYPTISDRILRRMDVEKD